MTAHTPGPWSVEGNNRRADIWVNGPKGFGHIALVATRGVSQEVHEIEMATARLIAAAPELLAALKAATYALGLLSTKHGDDTVDEELEQAQAAIAAAEGGQ